MALTDKQNEIDDIQKNNNNNNNIGYVRIVTDLVNSKSWIDRTSLIPDLANSFVFKKNEIINRNKSIRINDTYDTLFLDKDIIQLPSVNYRLMIIRREIGTDGLPSFKVEMTKQRGFIDDLSRFCFFKSNTDENIFYVLAIRHTVTEFLIDKVETSVVKTLFADFFTSGEPLSPVAKSISKSILYFRAFGGFIVEYLPSDSLDGFVDSAVVDKGYLTTLSMTGSAEIPLFNTFDVTTSGEVVSQIKRSTEGNINKLLQGSIKYNASDDGLVIKKKRNTHVKNDILKFFSDVKMNRSTNSPYANIQIHNVFPTLSYDQEATLCILHKVESMDKLDEGVIIYCDSIESLFDGEFFFFDDAVDIYNETDILLSKLLDELDKLALYRQRLKYNIVYAYKSLLQRDFDEFKKKLVFQCSFRNKDGFVDSIEPMLVDQDIAEKSIVSFKNFPENLDENSIRPIFVAIINNSIKKWSDSIQEMIDGMIKPNTDDQVINSFFEQIINPEKIAFQVFSDHLSVDDFNTAISIINGSLVLANDISKQFDTHLYSMNQALPKVARHDFQYKNGNYGYKNCHYDKYENGRFELSDQLPDVSEVRLQPLGNNIRLDFEIPTRAVIVMAPDDNSTSKSKTDAIAVYNQICYKAWQLINPEKNKSDDDKEKNASNDDQMGSHSITDLAKRLVDINDNFSINEISYYIYQHKVNFPESSYTNYGQWIWENPSNAYEHDCYIENRVKVSISFKLKKPSIFLKKTSGLDEQKTHFMKYLCDEFDLKEEYTDVQLILSAFDTDTKSKLQTIVDTFDEKQKLIDYYRISTKGYNQSALFLIDLYGRKRLLNKQFLSVLPFNVGNGDRNRQLTQVSTLYKGLHLDKDITLGMILEAKGLTTCYESPYKMRDIEGATGSMVEYQDILVSMFVDSI